MHEAPDLAPPRTAVSKDCINQLLREARTHGVWLPHPVSSATLRRAYELASFGPTSANTTPARFVFLSTLKAKERLRPALAPGNVDKTMAAPVTVIIAWDTEFYEKLPTLFLHKDMRSVFLGKPELIQETAFRNSSPRSWLLHSRCTRSGSRLRPDVWIRCRKSQRRVFSRWQVEIESSLQFRLRRRE